MALDSITQSGLIDEIVDRLGKDGKQYSKADVRNILKAFEEETIDCVANGYKVSLPGFVRFEPRFQAAKRKGELVRNPSSGEMAPRAEGQPAKFKVKAFASSALAKRLPSITSTQGKALKRAIGA